MPLVFFLAVGNENAAKLALDYHDEQFPPGDLEDTVEDRGKEGVNFYALIFKADKDQRFNPGEKAGPEPDPSPAELRKASRGFSQGAVLSSPALTAGKEQQMVNFINRARNEAGLPALQVNSQITAAARAKSKDMVDNKYFSHNSPTHGSFTSLLLYYGINYRTAGENLAWNTSGNVGSVHNNLMNSPGHRRNILSPDFQYVGVGIYVGSDGRHYYTQLFIGR